MAEATSTNLIKKPNGQLLIFQLTFWLGLCLVSFFTLTLWYQQLSWNYIAHTFLQSAMGAVLSLILRWVFIYLWNRPLKMRIALSICAIACISLLWTVLRISAFILITQEKHVWQDFGGWYFGGIFIFLCWSALYHGIRYYQLLEQEHLVAMDAERAMREEQWKRLKAEAEAKAAQLKMLRYQLNPHFLFNTLNAINALIRSADPRQAEKMITQLSRFLRHSLDSNPDQNVSLKQELDTLMLFLDIEKTRFGERLSVEVEVSEDANQARVPSLLLQPLVENSIKYAISKCEDGGTVSIRADVKQERLVIGLWDSGCGGTLHQSKVKSFNGRGIGLHNVVERLKTLYQEDYSFDLTVNDLGGLKVDISLPYDPEPPN